MKVNSNTIKINSNDSEFKELESVMSKIASNNGIDSVEAITIFLEKDSGKVKFKRAFGEEYQEAETPIENEETPVENEETPMENEISEESLEEMKGEEAQIEKAKKDAEVEIQKMEDELALLNTEYATKENQSI